MISALLWADIGISLDWQAIEVEVYMGFSLETSYWAWLNWKNQALNFLD